VNDSTWWYAQGDQRLGPVPWATLQSLAQSGVIQRDTLIWTGRMAAWQPAHAVEAMSHLFPAPPPLPQQPPPLPAASEPPAFSPFAERRAAAPPPRVPAASSAAPATTTATAVLPTQTPWASYPHRVTAAAVDLILVLVLTVVLPGLLVPGAALWVDHFFLTSKYLWLAALPSIGYPLYQAGMQYGKKGATWGQQLLRLKVTTESGGRLSFLRALGRACALSSYGILSFGVGLLMPLWTKRRQTLHDKLAGTVVVRSDASADWPMAAAEDATNPLRPWQVALLVLAAPLAMMPDMLSAVDFALTRHRANELHALATGVANKVTEQFEQQGRIPTLANLGVDAEMGDTLIELEDETGIITVTNRKTNMSIQLFPSRPDDNVQWRCTFTLTDNVELPFTCDFRRRT